MPLTLEDIARLSGVSRATVSRVVNGDEKVSLTTRQRVLDVIRQHHYQPNQAARRLAAGRTETLGLVIPAGAGAALTDPYFSRLIQGVAVACGQHDYSLMLWLIDPEQEERTIRRLATNNLVDGVVVSFTRLNDPIAEALRGGALPFVLIGHHPDSTINTVSLDNREAARLAARHLLEHGYRRIAMIGGPRTQIDAQER
ncbi:MAG: LacI family transcriptional regulator, partial [Anaerolineae bacterium]